MPQLKRADLLQTGAWINGEWTQATDGATFSVTNPADGSLVAEVADVGVAGAQAAVAAAHAAFESWRQTTAKQRAVVEQFDPAGFKVPPRKISRGTVIRLHFFRR